MPNQKIPMSKREAERLRDLRTTSRLLATAFIIGGVVVWLRFAVPAVVGGFTQKGWSATGQTFTALLWGAAWFASAFVFGFLFGIPKALQTSPQPHPSGGNATESSDTNPPPNGNVGESGGDTQASDKETSGPLRVNTNLEEISDWLTKILVGATLTQIVKIPGAIKLAAQFMASEGGGIAPVPFAAAIVLYFSAIGFFAGYVLTRMFFSLAFSRSDEGLSSLGLATSTTIDALATQIISPESDVETKEDAYNSIVFSLLYQPPPEGFEKAIQYAEEFLRQNTPTQAALYINLASAYGQKFRHLRDHNASDQELKKAKEGALAAARKAIEIDPESKRRLRELLHPKSGARDNDLEAFASDPDFTNLIDAA